jgi:hypothetical protein
MSGDESPFWDMGWVDRPESADPETMWDQLVDLCEHPDDLEALMTMRDEATK